MTEPELAFVDPRQTRPVLLNGRLDLSGVGLGALGRPTAMIAAAAFLFSPDWSRRKYRRIEPAYSFSNGRLVRMKGMTMKKPTMMLALGAASPAT